MLAQLYQSTLCKCGRHCDYKGLKTCLGAGNQMPLPFPLKVSFDITSQVIVGTNPSHGCLRKLLGVNGLICLSSVTCHIWSERGGGGYKVGRTIWFTIAQLKLYTDPRAKEHFSHLETVTYNIVWRPDIYVCNFNQNTVITIHNSLFENVACNMTPLYSGPSMWVTMVVSTTPPNNQG